MVCKRFRKFRMDKFDVFSGFFVFFVICSTGMDKKTQTLHGRTMQGENVGGCEICVRSLTGQLR